ncbi:AbrB/MazE/SpoVT family DNA-binding domain-containing protein [Streptomyces sp. NPDC005566]|uniref:AbrB/MazE/SpoVT family DNA-binding domain-containing protein n=1 Tax=Streptomyces sp. NPDC005566 TaxID=3156886 RepID=UPI0033A2430F
MTTATATLRTNGQVTLPKAIRAALGVEQGDELEFEITSAGEVTVHGLTKIRSDQAWFWTPEWQEGERRTSEDIAAGRTTVHEDTDSMFAHLDED